MCTQKVEEINRLCLADSLLRENFEMIHHADRKAQALLWVTLAIFAAAFVGVPPVVLILKDTIQQGGLKFGLFVAVAVLYAVCTVCLLMAIITIIGVIRPRKTRDPSLASGLLFQSIAQRPLTQFRSLVRQLSYEAAVDDRITQAYYSAVIADAKFGQLDRAISWMLGGGLVGVVFALIVLVSIGLL